MKQMIAIVYWIFLAIGNAQDNENLPPLLRDFENKTYADIIVANLHLSLQRDLGVQMRSIRKSLETKIDNKINSLESRIDNKINDLESRLSDRIDGIESRIDDRINGLEYKINHVESKLSSIDGRLASISTLMGVATSIFVGFLTAFLGIAINHIDWSKFSILFRRL